MLLDAPAAPPLALLALLARTQPRGLPGQMLRHPAAALACIDAAAADPAAGRLHLAAAAYLNAWWHAHPDTTDPLV